MFSLLSMMKRFSEKWNFSLASRMRHRVKCDYFIYTSQDGRKKIEIESVSCAKLRILDIMAEVYSRAFV